MSQAVHGLLVLALDLLGEVSGYVERPWFRIHRQHREVFVARVAVTRARCLDARAPVLQFDHDARPALAAFEQCVPNGRECMPTLPVFASVGESHALGFAMRTV